MKQNRVNRVLKALEDMGLSQMLIVDLSNGSLYSAV